jgi:dephospho-CoA kinase
MATDTPNVYSEHSDLSELKGRIPLVGLTGGIGSGKTAVSDLLGKLGVGIVDTDLIARQITAAHGVAMPAIQKQFGAEYLDSSRALDRAKMRALVFAEPEARKALEAITHPFIRQEAAKQAKLLVSEGAPYLVFVVPLLVESGAWQGLMDYLAVVDCPEETQITRVMQRSKLPRAEVERILQTQASRQERLACANIVIQNQGSLAELDDAVNLMHQKILQITKE